ncbi:MAG: hypothetical protein QME65_06590, partial [Candidatus Omnitrophota bacterium]|nr:hypothetical protein [Candidatus Omnitrophota bacterium]
MEVHLATVGRLKRQSPSVDLYLLSDIQRFEEYLETLQSSSFQSTLVISSSLVETPYPVATNQRQGQVIPQRIRELARQASKAFYSDNRLLKLADIAEMTGAGIAETRESLAYLRDHLFADAPNWGEYEGEAWGWVFKSVYALAEGKFYRECIEFMKTTLAIEMAGCELDIIEQLLRILSKFAAWDLYGVALKELLQDFPCNRRFLFWYGMHLYEHSGNLIGALRYLSAYVRLVPDAGEALLTIGCIYSTLKMHNEALSYLRRSLLILQKGRVELVAQIKAKIAHSLFCLGRWAGDSDPSESSSPLSLGKAGRRKAFFGNFVSGFVTMLRDAGGICFLSL